MNHDFAHLSHNARRRADERAARVRRERLRAGLWLLGLVLVAATGCTRAFWRTQADCCVYMAVNTSAQDPQWPMRDFTININPKSRLYDPTNPDRPPMPPDDPTLHQFMHCVNCMHGFPCWHQNGDNPYVANPLWQQFLPIDAQGNVVVDSTAAVQLGLLHSRDYQFNLEQLYLSALDVSFERFRFATQVFAGNDTFYTANGRLRPGNGGVPTSVLDTANGVSVQKLFGAGGTLVADVANNFMWQFAGTNSNSTNTLVDFTFIQPLLQYAGRARIMERLTLAERTMVGNVRQMQRYRQGFYVSVYTGRSLPTGPSRLGGAFGGAGLQGFTGIGSSGFGRVGGVGETGGGGGGISGGAGAAQAGGYLGIVQDMQQIENQEANVAGLRDSVSQMQAAYDAGRIDRFQVDFSRQALYNAESVLLNARAQLETDLDGFKLSLGLPPDTPLKVEDPVLEQFRLIDLRLTALQNDIADLLDELRAPGQAGTPQQLGDYLAGVDAIRERAAGHINLVEGDFGILDKQVPVRIRELQELAERARAQQGDVDAAAYSTETFQQRVVVVKEDFASLLKRFDATANQITQLVQAGEGADFDATRQRLVDLTTELSGQAAELSLVQARVKLDSITLAPIDMEPREAFTIARNERADLRNARASLVNLWRLVEFNANALEAGLDLVFSGDMGTFKNNPVNFRDATGQLRVGLQFDAPLTRVQERNLYRQSLIEYQQQRRAYMVAEDSIYLSLRLTLRTVDLDKLNFELRRGAVFIAIDQVDLTRLRLTQPPRPGETSQFGNTTARDLVDSLAQLLNVQNQFLSVWVNIEVLRRNLDFDLGTMQLDSRGIWLDPGPITGESYRRKWLDCPDGQVVPPQHEPEEVPPGEEPDEELPAAFKSEVVEKMLPSPLDREPVELTPQELAAIEAGEAQLAEPPADRSATAQASYSEPSEADPKVPSGPKPSKSARRAEPAVQLGVGKVEELATPRRAARSLPEGSRVRERRPPEPAAKVIKLGAPVRFLSVAPAGRVSTAARPAADHTPH
ncbi:MAG: TolC family protein [Planctomycetaceae bacterium]|nr:TolC family protein [Planctomycetaceae bacterium]